MKVILVMFVLVHIGAVVLAFGALVPSVAAPLSGGGSLWRPFWGLGPRSSGGRGWILPGALNSCLSCRSARKHIQTLYYQTSLGCMGPLAT